MFSITFYVEKVYFPSLEIKLTCDIIFHSFKKRIMKRASFISIFTEPCSRSVHSKKSSNKLHNCSSDSLPSCKFCSSAYQHIPSRSPGVTLNNFNYTRLEQELKLCVVQLHALQLILRPDTPEDELWHNQQ